MILRIKEINRSNHNHENEINKNQMKWNIWVIWELTNRGYISNGEWNYSSQRVSQ